MSDLDQGGTYRFLQKRYLGPSLGWANVSDAILRVTTGGTTIIELGNSYVSVSFNGAVTLRLPVFKNTNVALTGQMRDMPIVVVDTGGFAGAFPIIILPGAGETISSLASIQITSPFGAFILQPDPVNGGSTVVS